MGTDTIITRSSLTRTRNKLRSGTVTLGFIGGSITEDGRSAHNWPEPVTRWFAETFPRTRIVVENAAIGATGSDLALFRAERDLIERHCDLIFVEFAVNDYLTASEPRMRAREGLLRKLLADGRSELVLVYTYSQRMYEAMSRKEVPDSIAEFEQLAGHYGISSVWAGRHAWEEVVKGRMTWDEWLPDGLHPTHRGSLSYGQCVIALLERELTAAPQAAALHAAPLHAASLHAASPDADTDADASNPPVRALPQALNPHHWERTELVPFEEVQLEGPWTIRRAVALMPRVDRLLSTSAIGATLSFSFSGRGLVLVFDFGKKSAEFVYRLDGGEAVAVSRDRPDWCKDGGWLRPYWIADELPEGRHHIELEVVHGNREDCRGTDFHLGIIGILK
ncbi:GDSL-type esterase/lipase family protein [Cohnella sp. GCM10012308]|uniref:GDSL-type esterase/lipase family protein n=1 Tax=Cohnella sp. GCM10012308 TaxID=3317329 RepID=UPI003617B99C